MKQILITAGPVYGKLDDNKIVSNRSRGIWALKYAMWLHENTDHEAAVLVPDTMAKAAIGILDLDRALYRNPITVYSHNGYDDYRDLCYELAPKYDAAIMAAAVVNWIPETPFPGKMSTDKRRINIPFVLAPRVINEMKALNPKLTLIGCKLLFSEDMDTLVEAAYHVLLAARCNAVVANDALLGLKNKHIVHKDRAVSTFRNDFEGLYEELTAIIEDVHWSTNRRRENRGRMLHASMGFLAAVEQYQDRFNQRVEGEDKVFGSVAVRYSDPGLPEVEEFLISPREKGQEFDNWDAVVCDFDWENRVINTWDGKATLNAPLLARHLKKYPEAVAVVHFHGGPPLQNNPHVPVVPHAPPGTARDNERDIPGPCYYIKGHGWIIAIDKDGKQIV